MEAPVRIEPQRLGDYLEVMSKAAFQTGISWKVVENKWPGIKEALRDFDPVKSTHRSLSQKSELVMGISLGVPSKRHQLGRC